MRVSNPKINKEAIKTLVVAYGQREAARKAGLNVNTVMAWARRYGWQQAAPERSHAICTQSPADALATVLTQAKEKSALHLSDYVVNASGEATKLNGKRALKEAQNVRHVAAVREHLWPQEKQTQSNVMVNIALLGVDPQSVQVQECASARTIDAPEGTGTDKPAA